MRLLTAAAVSGEAPADRPPGRTTALAQVRAALAMIGEDPEARRLLSGSAGAPDTAGTLTDWLYLHWWCGSTGPVVTGRLDSDESARGAARLQAAWRTAAARSDGWLVLAAVGGQLVAAQLADRADRRVRTTADAVVISSRPGMPPRPGDLVTLRQGETGLDATGSWWWAHTGRPHDVTSGPLDRWYVHAHDLSAAAALIPLLLAIAAEAGCDASVKCPPFAAGYDRSDALVVYLPRDRASAAEAALHRRAAAIADLVAPGVPPLTRPLLPGVAQAQDPGEAHGPVSYGQLRCSQVAALAARVVSGDTGTVHLDDAGLVSELAELGIAVGAVQQVRS
jgi:hypothetical protein